MTGDRIPQDDGSPVDDSPPDFGKFVTETAAASEELGEMLGPAVAAAFGQKVGLGDMAAKFVGKAIGGPAGALAGGLVGADAYGVAELGHLSHEIDQWAGSRGGGDPSGGTLPPGGAPDNFAPDGGASDQAAYLGEADDPGFAPSDQAAYLGEADDPGFAADGPPPGSD
jgi:hypothetical protein